MKYILLMLVIVLSSCSGSKDITTVSEYKKIVRKAERKNKPKAHRWVFLISIVNTSYK